MDGTGEVRDGAADGREGRGGGGRRDRRSVTLEENVPDAILTLTTPEPLPPMFGTAKVTRPA